MIKKALQLITVLGTINLLVILFAIKELHGIRTNLPQLKQQAEIAASQEFQITAFLPRYEELLRLTADWGAKNNIEKKPFETKRAHWGRIAPGMSSSEVEALIGMPDKIQRQGISEEFALYSGEKPGEKAMGLVHYENGKVIEVIRPR